MSSFTELRDQVLRYCSEDHCGLWYIAVSVREVFEVVDPVEIRRITLDIVRDLLETGSIKAGFPTPDGTGFTTWSGSLEEIVGRIEDEWKAIGRDPKLGEIVWFTSPELAARQIAVAYRPFNLTELKQKFLATCREKGWVSPARIAIWLRSDFGIYEPQEVKRIILSVIKELLESGDIIAAKRLGTATAEPELWHLSASDAFARFEAEFSRLTEGSIPNTVWFSARGKGDSLTC